MDPASAHKLPKLLSIATALTLLGCGNHQAAPARPHAALAKSFPAQDAFQKLESHWSTATPNERLQLEPELVEFLRSHGADPEARLISLYLAWVVLEKGDVARAEALVSAASAGDPGRISDFARVMQAALWLKRDKPSIALDELERVRDKIIDPIERFICNELLIRAALAMQEPDRVTRYMLHFLIQAPPAQKDIAKEKLRTWLGQAPTATLERSFELLSKDDPDVTPDDREGARAVTWMLTTLRQYLTASALEAKDTALAKRLLDNYVPEGTSDALSDLASTGQYAPRISGRSVGLVLELESALQSYRSAEVAQGMTTALGSLQNSGEDRVQLKTRAVAEGRDGIRTALQQLSSDGASLLVVGVSDETTNVAGAFAESEHIPTILLRFPTAPVAAPTMSFVLGEAEETVEKKLDQWLAEHKAIAPIRISESDPACSSKATPIDGSAFPLALWRQNHNDALVVLTTESCGRTLIEELTRARFLPLLLLGLDTAHLQSLYPRSIAIKSGAFPDLLKHGGADQGIQAVSWYQALGHDAALLASAALEHLSPSLVTDPEQVEALKRQTAQELRLARVQGLWTTNGHGFTQGSRIERELEIKSE